VDFEFDPAKSSADKTKHGIDFVEARRFGWMKRSLKRRQKPTTSHAFSSLGASAGGIGRRSV
jgi:uncharacterized DUF497 family protein